VSNVRINLNDAKNIILNDGVVAIPTETVYGLGAWINSAEGIKKIFSTKERPFFDPLIVHIDSKEKAKALSSDWTPIHEILATECWPGPLTLISKKISDLNPMITSGLDSVGLRCPNHSLTLELLSLVEGGIAAPSANKFGRTSPTLADHVEKEFNGKVPILDGGPCSIGIESTVLGIERIESGFVAKIFRPGFYTAKSIKEILLKHGFDIEIIYHQSPVAPGQLEHHYMPQIPLIIVPQNFNWETSDLKSNFTKPAHWHQPSSANIASRELYAKMRSFDEEGFDVILCYQNNLETQEEWKGIWNRLEKAKSKKILP
jgi:L-threonylcarbamoyladenylate synthase